MENEKSRPMREGCPYRSIAPQRFKTLRGNAIYMDIEINQDFVGSADRRYSKAFRQHYVHLSARLFPARAAINYILYSYNHKIIIFFKVFFNPTF